jgi:hypothetical protein
VKIKVVCDKTPSSLVKVATLSDEPDFSVDGGVRTAVLYVENDAEEFL